MKRFNAATIWSISRGTRASSGFRSDGSRQLALHPHQRAERAMHAEGHQRQQQAGQHADRQQRTVDHVLRDASRARRVWPTCTCTSPCAEAAAKLRPTTTKRTVSPL
jgi:hypothetical protein